MCGGKGTRLDASVEKPLYEIRGTPMIDSVRAALRASTVESIVAAVSPHTPATRDHLRERDCRVVETPGDGYVADLDAAIEAAGLSRPVLTCVADLPLVVPPLVDAALLTHTACDGDSLTVAVPAAVKEALGVSVDTTFARGGRDLVPSGLNVLGDGGDNVLVSGNARLAVNVNCRRDAEVATLLAPPFVSPGE